MGAETGATSSFFPFDDAMARYLRATERADLADLAEKSRDLITADPEIEAYPDRFFDRVLELDLSELEPYVVGPGSPDRARPLSKFKEEVHR
jgi:aconitate hydratase